MCGFIFYLGKGESNIDKMIYNDFELIYGNIVCNSYKKFKEDVRILKEIYVSDLNINLYESMKFFIFYFKIYMNRYVFIIMVIFLCFRWYFIVF